MECNLGHNYKWIKDDLAYWVHSLTSFSSSEISASTEFEFCVWIVAVGINFAPDVGGSFGDSIVRVANDGTNADANDNDDTSDDIGGSDTVGDSDNDGSKKNAGRDVDWDEGNDVVPNNDELKTPILRLEQFSNDCRK